MTRKALLACAATLAIAAPSNADADKWGCSSPVNGKFLGKTNLVVGV